MAYLGVDVAKDSLEVATASGSPGRSFPNTRTGIAKLVSWVTRSFAPGEVHLVLEPPALTTIPWFNGWLLREFLTP